MVLSQLSKYEGFSTRTTTFDFRQTVTLPDALFLAGDNPYVMFQQSRCSRHNNVICPGIVLSYRYQVVR